MKLQNKKTDVVVDVEIRDVFYDNIAKFKLINKATGSIIAMYNSLAELNAEWKDYEGPKGYWRIDCDGTISHDRDEFDTPFDNACKSIGNYFETEEEAEKAVEKLKAWKRLKEKGHKFGGIYCDYILSKNKPVLLIEINGDTDEQDKADLKLLFGGEE